MKKTNGNAKGEAKSLEEAQLRIKNRDRTLIKKNTLKFIAGENKPHLEDNKTVG